MKLSGAGAIQKANHRTRITLAGNYNGGACLMRDWFQVLAINTRITANMATNNSHVPAIQIVSESGHGVEQTKATDLDRVTITRYKLTTATNNTPY